MAAGAVPVRMHLRDPGGSDQADPEDARCLLGMHVYVKRRSDDVEAPQVPVIVDFRPTQKKFSLRFLFKYFVDGFLTYPVVQGFLSLVPARLRERYAPDVNHFSRHRLRLQSLPFHATWENDLRNYVYEGPEEEEEDPVEEDELEAGDELREVDRREEPEEGGEPGEVVEPEEANEPEEDYEHGLVMRVLV